MYRLASLLFWLLRVLHRRGHGQAGVSYGPATSGASSTRAWTGRRPKCLATSGATSTRACTGKRLFCSGYFGCYIDEGMARQAFTRSPGSGRTANCTPRRCFQRNLVRSSRRRLSMAQCRVRGRRTGQIFRVQASGLQCCAQRISARLVPVRLNPTRLAQSAALSRGVCQKKGSRGRGPTCTRKPMAFFTPCDFLAAKKKLRDLTMK